MLKPSFEDATLGSCISIGIPVFGLLSLLWHSPARRAVDVGTPTSTILDDLHVIPGFVSGIVSCIMDREDGRTTPSRRSGMQVGEIEAGRLAG